jgi:hypothetical protein
MGFQPGARFPARSADAVHATLYGRFTQAINRSRPIQETRARDALDDVASDIWATLARDILGPAAAGAAAGPEAPDRLKPRLEDRHHHPHAGAQLGPCVSGRGLHSSTFQLNLSRS